MDEAPGVGLWPCSLGFRKPVGFRITTTSLSGSQARPGDQRPAETEYPLVKYPLRGYSREVLLQGLGCGVQGFELRA